MNNQIKLKDIKGLSFIGGQITARIEAKEEKGDASIGAVKIIPPKAIKSGQIEGAELYELEYKTEFDDKKLTREGDIVLKLTSPYDAAYITKEYEGLLIPSFCIIIRNTGNTVDSEYLLAFMNSEQYLIQAMSMATGAGVPMLTIGKVKEVAIKSLPIDEQKKIAEYYKNICEKEKVMAQIIKLEKEKLDVILGGM